MDERDWQKADGMQQAKEGRDHARTPAYMVITRDSIGRVVYVIGAPTFIIPFYHFSIISLDEIMASRTRLSLRTALRLCCHGFKDRAIKFHSRGREPGDEATSLLLCMVQRSRVYIFIRHYGKEGKGLGLRLEVIVSVQDLVSTSLRGVC